MAKVSELKERARAYEKEGEHEKALKIYLHVLSHLEGSPAIMRELPMYVKAGDLQIRLEDTAGAIASYEKAAEQYAEHGSAKSVIALAAKVLRVDPMKADFHLVHTRALIDHGHIAAARDVLADYADRSGLEKTQEALRALEGQEDHARPLLEMILDSAERGERASTEETAKRVSVQLGALVTLDDPPAEEEADTEQPVGEDREEEEQGEDEEDEEEQEESEELESKPVFDPRSMFETVEQLSTIEAPPLDLGGGLLSSDAESLVEHGTLPPLDDGPAPPEPIAPSKEVEPVAPPPTPEPVSSGQKESGGGDLTFEPDGSAFTAQPVGPKSDPVRPRSDPFMPPSDPPPRRAHAARAPSGVLTQRSEKKGIPVWVWGAGVVVIGGGVVFVMMRGGGETAPTIPPAIVDTTPPPQPVATVDTSALGLNIDSAVLDPNDSLALALGGSLDSLTEGDSALLDSIRVTAGSLAVGDSATGGPATDTTGPPVVAPAPATAGPAYIIDGSTVQDVVQYSRQGRSGWRTIQTLSTGERVTVETTMANVNDPNEMDQGATNVTSDADGSVGTTRIDNLIVTVTGSVSEASMRELITLLAEHNQ